MTDPDLDEWVKAFERDASRLKVTIQSAGGKVPRGAVMTLAARIESVYKDGCKIAQEADAAAAAARGRNMGNSG